MGSRIALPDTARGRTILVGTALAALLGVGAGIVGAVHRATPSTASLGVGLGAPASLPVVARFPASTTSTSARLPGGTRAPDAPESTTTRAVPATLPSVDIVFTPPTSGPSDTSAPLPVPAPVPTTGPRILLDPAVTATLPPPPPPLGADALTWTAPAALDIPAGTSVSLTVVGHNPTARDVDLPHPLACTPRLDHGETCAPEVQRIAAHASASATYTIDALGIAPGHYTLSIEGVLTIAVTVS